MAVLTPTWLTSSDRIVGASHPQFNDTVNAGVISLNTALLVGHEQTGFHSARRTGLSGEIDSFSGNGAARTITLSNTGLTPKKIFVWEEESGAELVSNGGFDSATTGWTAGTGASIASVSGGQSGNCLEITHPNLVSNGGFDSDVSGWTDDGSCSIASVSGGESGNCCRLTSGAGGNVEYFYQQLTGLDTGSAYNIFAYTKAGTMGNVGAAIWFKETPGNILGVGTVVWAGNLSGSWTKRQNASVTPSQTTMYLQFTKTAQSSGYTGQTQLFDTATIPALNVDAEAYQSISGLVVGRTYTISIYVKSGSYGDVNFAVNFDGGDRITGSSTSSWVQHSVDYQYTGSSPILYLRNEGSGNAGTMLFDTVSISEAQGNAPIRLDNMTSDKAQPSRFGTFAWEADLIDNEQAGSFDVGDSGINSSGITNYYCVLGIDEDTTVTGDAGAGSDPTWVPSGTAYTMIADGTATVSSGNYGNNVVSEMWTLWLEEHDNTGAHTVTLQHKRVETISWSGNDADNRDISCAITDLDIDYIEVYEDGMPVASKSTDMSGDTTKDEDAAAFAADLIQDITTNGEFTIGTGLNASGNTYVAFIVGD